MLGTSTGQSTLASLGAREGFAFSKYGDTVYFEEQGWRSDVDRFFILTSFMVDDFSLGDAEYRISYLNSTAGTPLFRVTYQLYYTMRMPANYTGQVVLYFGMPAAFLSQMVDDGGTDINRYGVYAMNCIAINNAQPLPAPIAAYIYTNGVYVGHDGPAVYTLLNYEAYSVNGTGEAR